MSFRSGTVRAGADGRTLARQVRLVLEEARGPRATKHALLAELAREQGIGVQLTLAI